MEVKDPDISELDELIAELENNERNIKFSRALAICSKLFGEYRVNGSHHIFKTPWQGDPRVNLQKDGKTAKVYQVRQIIKCIRRLKQHEH